jgi:Bacterial SH3 domain
MTMQLAKLVSGVGVLLATAALAAPGDALLVTGSNVNVRAGPGTDAGILTRVGVREPAIEMRREGQWVEVELPDQDVLGWIHGSLLTSAPKRAPAPQAAPGPEPGPQPGPQQPQPSGQVATLEVPATAAPATGLPPDADTSDGTPLGRFRSEVAYFNNRAVAAAGVDLFTGVAPLGDNGVQVVATEAWATMPASGQQSYLNALFRRWRAAAGSSGRELRLEIVDPNGVLMMERSGR